LLFKKQWALFSWRKIKLFFSERRTRYQSKDGNQTKIFDALEWFAAMCSHIPNRGDDQTSGSHPQIVPTICPLKVG